jgi:very-short-patch-repair endonuclease
MSRYYSRKKWYSDIKEIIFAILIIGLFGVYVTYRTSLSFVLTALGFFAFSFIVIIFGKVSIFTFVKRMTGVSVQIGQTSQARLLWAALKERGIDAITEYDDGHKRVDLAVLPAKMYIEVDGSQHNWDVQQVISDLKRDNYSDHEGFRTARISNQAIKADINAIADELAKQIRERQETIA